MELSIRRVLKCRGCGVCVGKCPNDVIAIDDGVAVIGNGCVHCGKCIEICPVCEVRVRDLAMIKSIPDGIYSM